MHYKDITPRGTHCQNVYVTPLLVLLFLAVFSKYSSSQSTSVSVSSVLEALAMMRYINPRFTLHYITLYIWRRLQLTRNVIGLPVLYAHDYW